MEGMVTVRVPPFFRKANAVVFVRFIANVPWIVGESLHGGEGEFDVHAVCKPTSYPHCHEFIAEVSLYSL
jgi:hypothetical protein